MRCDELHNSHVMYPVQHNGKSWQRVIIKGRKSKIFVVVLGQLTNRPFKQQPQGVFYEWLLLSLLLWKVLFWTDMPGGGFFSAARQWFSTNPVCILNKVTHIKLGKLCLTVPQKLLCTLL